MQGLESGRTLMTVNAHFDVSGRTCLPMLGGRV
jgi:hypothetical protein